jgi:hypothetical protein
MFHARSAHGVRPSELCSSRAAVRSLLRLYPPDVGHPRVSRPPPLDTCRPESSQMRQDDDTSHRNGANAKPRKPTATSNRRPEQRALSSCRPEGQQQRQANNKDRRISATAKPQGTGTPRTDDQRRRVTTNAAPEESSHSEPTLAAATPLGPSTRRHATARTWRQRRPGRSDRDFNQHANAPTRRQSRRTTTLQTTRTRCRARTEAPKPEPQQARSPKARAHLDRTAEDPRFAATTCPEARRHLETTTRADEAWHRVIPRSASAKKRRPRTTARSDRTPESTRPPGDDHPRPQHRSEGSTQGAHNAAKRRLQPTKRHDRTTRRQPVVPKHRLSTDELQQAQRPKASDCAETPAPPTIR